VGCSTRWRGGPEASLLSGGTCPKAFLMLVGEVGARSRTDCTSSSSPHAPHGSPIMFPAYPQLICPPGIHQHQRRWPTSLAGGERPGRSSEFRT